MVRLPRNATLSGAWSDLMGAAPADAEITRVQLEVGSQKMVIVAYELFARVGDDFAATVRRQTAKAPMKVTVEEWQGHAPLHGYAYYPTTPPQHQETNFIMGLYVALPDRTVEHLVFLANEAVAKDPVTARLLASSIAGALDVGKRSLDASPGQYALFTFSATAVGAAVTTHSTPVAHSAVAQNGETIFVTVPDGFVATEEIGIDFSVNRIRKVAPFGELTPGILVYVGDHAPEPEGTKQASVVLMGKQTQWYERTITGKDGKTSLRDVALVSPVWSRASQVEVSLQAEDKAGIDELRKIAETLTIRKPK